MTMRQQIIEFLNSGQTIQVEFVKRSTGEVRMMNCIDGPTEAIRQQRTGSLKYEPQDYNLASVYDVDKKEFRMVNLDALVSVSVSS